MNLLTSVGGIASQVSNLFSFLYPPLGELYAQKTWQSAPIRLPDIGTLIHLRLRGTISSDTFYAACNKQGLDDGWVNQLLAGAQQLLSSSDAFAAWRRGIISESERNEHLNAQGISGDLVPVMSKLTEFYPGPMDLIRFAVREVYSPQVVEKFEMMEDLPPQFISEAAKAGVSREQAANYWASHWDLPSPQMGFEMMHRRIISRDELEMLLKALDIMPFWRNKIVELSYNPLTRVDVRRMYRLGVMSEDDLYNAYLDLGYSPDNAKLLVEFTKKYESGEDRGITRASIQSAYKKGLLTQEEFVTYLAALDYPETTIAFWLELTEYEMMEKEVDDKIDDVTNLYKLGELSLEQVQIELDKLGLSAEVALRVQKELEAQKSTKIKLPTQTDLTDWLKKGIIDQIAFGIRMKSLGYKEEDIVNFLTEAQEVTDITKRKYLAEKHYQELYKKDIISKEYMTTTLLEKGLSQDDIDALVEQVERRLANESTGEVASSGS